MVFNDALTQRLYVVDAEGGSPQILGGPEVVGGHPMFDAEGRNLLYNAQGSIWRVPVGSMTGTRIVAADGVHQKVLAPDGRSLYFTRARTGTTIWRYDLVTRATTQILDGLLAGYWGAWTPGRDGIYLLAESSQPTGGAAVVFHP